MPIAHSTSNDIVALEKKFWQSMVDQDPETAIGLLAEPALMVSAHGAMKFGHVEYRKMSDEGDSVVTSYQMDDVNVMFPNDDTAVVTYHVKQGVAPRGKKESTSQDMNDSSTWIRTGGQWKCVMHTETPAAKPKN